MKKNKEKEFARDVRKEAMRLAQVGWAASLKMEAEDFSNYVIIMINTLTFK